MLSPIMNNPTKNMAQHGNLFFDQKTDKGVAQSPLKIIFQYLIPINKVIFGSLPVPTKDRY